MDEDIRDLEQKVKELSEEVGNLKRVEIDVELKYIRERLEELETRASEEKFKESIEEAVGGEDLDLQVQKLRVKNYRDVFRLFRHIYWLWISLFIIILILIFIK